MGVIVFNGISSKDVGIEVETFPAYIVPEKEYEIYHVPGRSGDIVVDTGNYKNVARSYYVSIATWDEVSYSKKINRVAEWLHSASGYARLEDSYDEDFFRMAYYNEQVSIENLFNQAGRATINFECKPQRYLKTGEYPVVFNNEGIIQNGTTCNALPLIKITKSASDGAGAITIGDDIVAILAGSNTEFYIDCERQDAFYYNNQNIAVSQNQYIQLYLGTFPRLKPGSNTIYFTGGISSVEVIPRWWTI
jgi:phage-related protein